MVNIRNTSNKEWSVSVLTLKLSSSLDHMLLSWGKVFDFHCKCLCNIIQNASQSGLLQPTNNMDGRFAELGLQL
jgi:hypothetical protein